jgi:integrase
MDSMLANKKVETFNKENVYDHIQKFIKKKSYKSENTAKSYEASIRKFFKIVKDKEVEHLLKSDLDLDSDVFEEFQASLHGQVNNKTINNNIAAVKELIKYLRSKKVNGEYVIQCDIGYLNSIDSLPEHKNEYGVLSIEEIETMTELIMTMPRVRDREIKKYLFLFSLDTCARLDNCLELKWSDFRENENDVQINLIAKGNKDFRPRVSKGFYNELLAIKGESEKVFPISKNAVADIMAKLRSTMNINENRNIVFHSIRKAGGTFQYRLHGSITAAQKALGHSNINTTTIYLEDEDYGLTGAVSSKGRVSDKYYEEVDHETLLKAINKLTKSQKLMLNIKIDEIIKNN